MDRIWRLYLEEDKIKDEENKNLEYIYHSTVKKVTKDYESLNFNTAISGMMIFINAVYKENVFPREYALNFLKLLCDRVMWLVTFMSPKEKIWSMKRVLLLVFSP